MIIELTFDNEKDGKTIIRFESQDFQVRMENSQPTVKFLKRPLLTRIKELL